MSNNASTGPNGHNGHSTGIAHRSKEALRLKLQGFSFGEIAEQLGYGSSSAAYDAYRSALDWATVELPLQEIIQEEVAKLDQYASRLAKFNTERAVEVLVKVSERKARLLGLDAPEKKLVAGFGVNTSIRVEEVDEEFIAGVIAGLSKVGNPALAAHNPLPVDSPQTDSETGSVPRSAAS